MINQIPNLQGDAHWSARGELESEMWNWYLKVDGEQIPEEVLRGERGVEFAKKIKPYLPHDCETEYMKEPLCIPGDVWTFDMPMGKVNNLEDAVKVLREFFPRTYE